MADAFKGCGVLDSFTNYQGVSSVGDRAFAGTSITSFDFNNINSVGTDSFSCANLTDIDLSGSGIRDINHAFRNSGVVSATISTTQADIEDLKDCSNLTDIYCDYTYAYRKEMIQGEDAIPQGIVWHYGDIDVSLYRYFNWVINSGNSVTCNGFKYALADEKFAIPFAYTDDFGNEHEIRNFGANAFRGEARITNLDMPESVTSVSSGAFADCTNITEIHIPKAMEYIYDNAFNGCTNLQTVYYNGTKEEFLQSQPYMAWTVGNESLENAHWVFSDCESDFPAKGSYSLLEEDEIDLSGYEEFVLEADTILYMDRGTDAKVLKMLENGSVVYIIVTEQGENGIWYEVYTADQVRGYIFIESSAEDDIEEETEIESETEESTESEESTNEESSETEESTSDEESSETEESTNEESSGVESTETDESVAEEGTDERFDVEDSEESSGVAESTSEDASTDESTTVEESSVVEVSEEVVIEEGGEEIPEETESEIPEVKIEMEIKDEDGK